MKVLHTQGVMTTRPAWLGSKGVAASVALRQCLQQCLCLLQISGVKPLGEPGIDWCQEVMGFLAFPLLLPESSQAGGGTEFPGFRLLALGYRYGLLVAGFGFSVVV